MVKLVVDNFMSIGHAEVDLTDSIINFCGYNDSGKSAMLKAIEILMYDSYATKQARFIKKGANKFDIKLIFDDGVTIRKCKTTAGTNMWELIKDNQVIYTNKVGNAYAAVSGVPQPIADYMGVLKDENTKEKLNVRKKADKLFLIQTTGGENYKILNEILKADVLSNASKMLNEDRLKLQAELIRQSTKYDTLKEEYNSIECVQSDVLDDVRAKTDVFKSANNRLNSLGQLVETRGTIAEAEAKTQLELDIVPVDRIKAVYEVVRQRQAMGVAVKPEVHSVDTAQLQDIKRVVDSRLVLSEVSKSVSGEPVAEIDMSRLEAVLELAKLFNEVFAHNKKIRQLDNDIEVMQSEANEIVKANNLRVCKNCGSLVEE